MREGWKKAKEKEERGIQEVPERENLSVHCSLSHHPVCCGLGGRLFVILSCECSTAFYFGRDLMLVICNNFFFLHLRSNRTLCWSLGSPTAPGVCVCEWVLLQLCCRHRELSYLLFVCFVFIRFIMQRWGIFQQILKSCVSLSLALCPFHMF